METSQPTWISHGERMGDIHEVAWGCLCLVWCSSSAPGWVPPKPFPLMVGIRKLQQTAAFPGDVGRPLEPFALGKESVGWQGVLDGWGCRGPGREEHQLTGSSGSPFPTSWQWGHPRFEAEDRVDVVGW